MTTTFPSPPAKHIAEEFPLGAVALDGGSSSPAVEYSAASAEYWLSGQGAGPGWRTRQPWFVKYVWRVVNALSLGAERGQPDCQYYVGRFHEAGFALPRDPRKAAHFYRLAAEQGHPRAQAALGHCLEYGIGTWIDMAAAKDWYAMSAGQGDPEGQFNLGRCFEQGIGGPPDLVRAATYYATASRQGHKYAGLRECSLLRRGIEASSIKTLDDDVRPSVKASELFGSSDGEVRVRAGVIVIPGGMFRGSNWVRGLTFEPECQVGMIDEYSFYGTGLRSVDIPASVEVIGDASFANCTLLASVRFESDRRLRVIGEDAFWGIAIQSVEIPGSVRIVGEWSFAWCRRLRRVALPGSDSESRVGACAFAFTPYRSQSNPGGGVAPSIRRCSSHETLTELKSRFDRLGKPRCDPCSALLYSKALELAHAKRHSDAFKMYIRAMYAVEKGDQGIILRIMLAGGMETFASLPDINGHVIDRWSGFFSWLRTRIMCPASKSAAIELCSMAEGTDDKGDAARLRWKGVFLELLGYFCDNYWELPRGMRLYIEELSTKKWPFRKE